MSRIARIVTLIIAGEMIFGLPFHLTRFFRPTYLDAFGLSNTDLGIMQAGYGVAAILAYFPGGALADRFSTRKLLAGSLVVTAAGGLYLATYPDLAELRYLNFFWGFSTIFLFWAALIRATREWGGHDEQGVAFGLLEAGRGLLAVTVAFVAVRLFASLMPADVAAASDEVRRDAFRIVIFVYSALPVVAAALVWRFIPEDQPAFAHRHSPWQGMWVVLQRPVVWGQAIVIVCAYTAFRATDNYGLYAYDVLGMNEVNSAEFAAYGNLIRPFAA
ncbi:MAG: MFS transporter, partial [Woeseiaceae bacterium]|nr:MFS transporter [Woeseiaceae bacterium]